MFTSNEEMDLNRLHEFLSGIVARKQTNIGRQVPMDFEERTNLMESRTSTYCELIKIVQVFNSIISENLANVQQFKSDLQAKVGPLYAKINDIDTQFSKDNANREHYNLPSFTKQLQPMDEEISKENITTLLKTLDAKTESIKHQMRSTMKANGQTDSSTDDNRSSTGSYKGKGLKNSKPTSYCSACGEPDHNASKCKIKHTLFCDFCNKKGHAAKACRHRMNGHSVYIHCRIDHGNEPCQRSQLNNRGFLWNSPSMSTGLPKPTLYNHNLQAPPKPYGYDVYPPPGGRTPGQNTYQHTRYPGLNENQNFGPSRSSTPVGSPSLDQLNQTLPALSAQNQTAINQLIKTQTSQKEAFITMAEAEEKRAYDLDFTSVLIFDGKNKAKFYEWFRRVQYTCAYSNQNLHKELLRRSAGTVTTMLLKMNAATRADKIKKKLQEHFGQIPTQLHACRELTKAQMKPDETIIEFNDRYTVLLKESTEEIPETCKSKIIIVAYIDALQDDVGRKLRANIAKFEDEPHHPKAIRTLRDAMN